MDRDFHRRGGQVVNIFHHYIYLHCVFKLYDHVNSFNNAHCIHLLLFTKLLTSILVGKSWPIVA